MGKKILVMGGSYFAGRIFTILASREPDWELTLVNRGRYSMSALPRVRELVCDRRDAAALRRLPSEAYDAVVDFCAYSWEDVSGFFRDYSGSFGQYILLSTADVYVRTGTARDESTPLLEAQPSGQEGEYLFGKVQAEWAARDECARRGIPLTILRPAFIYGPYNYAPRESFFIQRIVQGLALPLPVDAAARFQFVYVKDVAAAIMACIRSPGGVRSYNLAAPEVLDYPGFFRMLEAAADRPFSTWEVTVRQAMAEGIPLPFPLLREEEELFDGGRICRELDFAYTPIREGMEKTYLAFKPVYEGA